MSDSGVFKAVVKLAPEQRAAFLDQACGTNQELRREVESLLRAHDAADSFLQSEPARRTGTVDYEPVTERPGTMIGPYKLMEQIGEGGMGLVFVAEQHQPVRRKVALKVIKPGMDTKEVVARFEAERQALALMDHPNIAKVLDAGTTDTGRPYFVMELVKGIPITDYCDHQQLTPRERLELFVHVCQAVQHAHTKGVIHRDLKPSNVLVAPHDGVPVIKVIDFGVAKALGQQLTDKTLYTRLHQMIGTPLYVSPEQAEVNQLDVDTRSDVYSLGVLLYELLTGTTPFERERFATAAFDEIRRIIKEEEPPKPSTRLSTLSAARRKTGVTRWTSSVKGDLDWIVMKALEKDRSRRYDTASAFAADVRRYLAEEPIEARPPSAWYRLRKTARRYRAAMLLTAFVVGCVLVAGFAILTNQQRNLMRVMNEHARARHAEEMAEERLKQMTKEKERAEEAEEGAQAVLEFTLLKLVETARPKGLRGGLGRDVTVRAALDAAEPELEKRFAGRPKIEAIIRNALGENLSFLGESTRAVRQLERAVQLRRQEFGPEHPATLQSLLNLAWATRNAGRLHEALAMMEDVLPRVRKTLGADDSSYLGGLNNYAEALMLAGRYDQAKAALEEVLVAARRDLGPDHPITLHVQSNLGDALRYLGQTDKALAVLEDTMRRASKVLPADHSELLNVTNQLAAAYHAAGRKAEAQALIEKAVVQATKDLGADHPSTLLLKTNLAEVYSQQKRYDHAIRLLEDVLTAAARTRQVGPFDVALAEVRLGECYYQLKQYDRAEVTLRRGYESFKKIANLPPFARHAVIKALDRLDTMCQLQGKKAEAEAWHKELQAWRAKDK